MRSPASTQAQAQSRDEGTADGAIRWQSYYWNARSPFSGSDQIESYSNWSQTDADMPFDEDVQFKFLLR